MQMDRNRVAAPISLVPCFEKKRKEMVMLSIS
jgi:hypothetical protein